MAIKGYLNEINFIELLKIIGKHDGKLGIWNFASGKQYEIFFKDEQLTYINQSGKNLSTRQEIISLLKELSVDDKSYYKFEQEAFSFESDESVISLAEFFEMAMSENVAEPAKTDALPNLETRFETVNKIDIELFGDLNNFWNVASSMLHKGASGREISNVIGLAESETQQALYNLRMAGLIKPMRVFNTASPRLREKMLSRAQKPRHDQAPVSFENIIQREDLLELDMVQDTMVAETVAAVPQFKKEEMIATAPMPEFLRELAKFEPAQPTEIVSPTFTKDVFVAQTVDTAPIVETESNIVAAPSVEERKEVEIFSTDSEKTGLLKRMLNSLFRK